MRRSAAFVMTPANDQTVRSRLSGHDDKPLVPSHNPYTYSISKFCRTLKNAHTVRRVWWSISNSKSHYPHYFCSLLVNCITSSRQNPSASVVNFISWKRWRKWIVRYLQFAINRTEILDFLKIPQKKTKITCLFELHIYFNTTCFKYLHVN